MANDMVYVGSEGNIGKKLYAFTAATGSQKWAYNTGSAIHESSPSAPGSDGTVYHAGISGTVQ